jgi:acetolactate synthase-1/2/3 large subunit
MLPREILTEMWSDQDIRSYRPSASAMQPRAAADPMLVERLADALIGAKSPILLTSYAGRTPGASEAILKLAEFAGIRVYEANMVSNISHDSPCFCGFQAGSAIAQADVGLLVDVDVPWFPARHPVPEKRRSGRRSTSTWSRAARRCGASRRACACRATAPHPRAGARSREGKGNARVPAGCGRAGGAEFAAENAKRLERAAGLAANPGKPGAINAHYLCRELGKRIAPEDVIFSEATRNTPAVQQQIPRSVAGTVVRVRRRRAWLLRWHGARHQACAARAHGDSRSVGDGSFYFNVTDSVFAVSKQYKLPILTVVLDNGGWSGE